MRWSFPAVYGRYRRGRAAAAPDPRRQPGPLAQQRAGLAGVDDLLDLEHLRGADGERFSRSRSRPCGIALELGELGLVRHLETAFDRQRTPVTRRPGVAEVGRARLVVGRAGHAERLADDDGAERARRLAQRGEGGEPRRIVTSSSDCLPMRKPGQSSRWMSGRWNVDARSMKRVTLREASAVQAPP